MKNKKEKCLSHLFTNPTVKRGMRCVLDEISDDPLFAEMRKMADMVKSNRNRGKGYKIKYGVASA